MRLSANMDAAYAALGSIQGMAQGIKKDRVINSVIKYSHATLANEFDLFMDQQARAASENLHHVYEWPKNYGDQSAIGNPAGRLWRHSLTGEMLRKTASYYFIASVKPSPVNPILLEPGPSGRKVQRGVHIFYLKASAMEYGMEIEVRPKLARYLAFVNRTAGGGGSSDAHPDSSGTEEESSGISFGTVSSFTAGGGKTTNQFIARYSSWWSTQGQTSFDEKIVPVLQKDFYDDDAIKVIRTNLNRSSRNSDATYKKARKAAIDRIEAKRGKYERGAAARLNFVQNAGAGGDGE